MATTRTLPRFDHLSLMQRVLLPWRLWNVVRKHDRRVHAQLVPVRSIGVVGDARSYDPTVFLQPRKGLDYSVPHVSKIATDIVNSVPGVGRVMLDITPLASS